MTYTNLRHKRDEEFERNLFENCDAFDIGQGLSDVDEFRQAFGIEQYAVDLNQATEFEALFEAYPWTSRERDREV